MASDFPSDGQPRYAAAPAGGAGMASAQYGQGGASRRPPGGVHGVLHIIGGNDRGKQHTLDRPEIHVGRGADQDVVLADIAVSRRHFTIAVDGERYRLQDLGSGNGTLVNGMRHDSVLLADGDQIEAGNTVMRLAHAPSRAAATPLQAGPDNRTMIGDGSQLPLGSPPPAYAPPPAYPPPPAYEPAIAPPPAVVPEAAHIAPVPVMPQVVAPAPMPRVSTPAMVPKVAPRRAMLDTPAKKIAVLGTVALLVAVAAGVVVKQVFFNDHAKAQKSFEQGQRRFADNDFQAARQLFVQARELDPNVPMVNAFVRRCDAEIAAAGKLQSAEALAEREQWDEALKTIEAIDKSTKVYKKSAALRERILPQAVAALLDEAKKLAPSDRAAAQTRVEQALLLDPASQAAAELDRTLKATAAPDTAVAAVVAPTPKPPVLKPKPVEVKPATPAAAPLALLSSPAGAPYRSKDFAGAAAALSAIKGPQQRAAAALASQVSQLGQAYDQAQNDRNPQGAIAAYQRALSIDGKVAQGHHAALFKGQLGRLEKMLAQQALQQGKLDVAFEAAKACARYGVDDGGVQAQLKSKAAQLVAQADGLKQSNLARAKELWRQVVRIVPPTDPSYARAAQGLKSTQTSAPSDEDE